MSELPRLLLCSFDVIPAPSGSSRRMTEYLKGLSDRFNVVVLSAKTPDHSHIQKFEGARLLRVPVGTGDLVSRLQAFDRAVRRQLESEEYVIAHFTDPFGGYALCELRESYGYKLIYEAQSFPSQELRFTHPQLESDRKLLSRIRRQELFCLMNADRVITGSEVTREYIHSLGVSPESVEVLRAPVDLGPYAQEALGAPDAAPMRALYLGSQLSFQGLPTLLRAVQIALRSCELRLVLVGPSHTAWQPMLQGLIEALRLGDKVELQPPVAHEDLHKLLATADIGLLPLEDVERNRVQGGALSKVAEYLAAGRPVIASDLPVARELLPEAVALFHEPGDPEDLAECLVALAQSPRRRVTMGAAAFELARTQHDAARIRERVVQLYLEVGGLSPLARSEEGEDAGPAPTVIAPSGGSGTGSGTGSRRGTEPAAHARLKPGGSEEERQASKSAAERRRERRRKRRLDLDSAACTDPAVAGPDELPQIVMGTPLHEPVRAPATLSAPPSGSAGLPAPPPLPPRLPDRPGPSPHPPPILRPATPPPLPALNVASTADEEPALVDPDEVQSADDVEEIHNADDAVVEALDEPERGPAAPPQFTSSMDPWFAQLVHGYCPPEGAPFARPTPPTNFPGREGPPPATVQPTAPVPQTFPTRSGGG